MSHYFHNTIQVFLDEIWGHLADKAMTLMLTFPKQHGVTTDDYNDDDGVTYLSSICHV